jgi:predicted nucleotidyltransferase
MELEKIKEKLDKKTYDFFYNFREQLELPLYFFGSIARCDFIKGKSDLDIEVFSENIHSTKFKVDSLFHYYYQNKETKYIVLKINGTPISGYKYSFKNMYISFDFTIYKKECKEILLHQRNIESNIPFVLVSFLIIIKYLYYYLNIITNNQYSFIKKKIWLFYNNEKSLAQTYYKEDYLKYVRSENNDKRFLI